MRAFFNGVLALTGGILITFGACSSESKSTESVDSSTPTFKAEKVNIKEDNKGDHINWVSFEEMQELMKNEPRKVFIDFYTNWCGPCKMMAKQTFTNKEIIRYMNENYYAIKFNAESGEPVMFKDKKFTNPNYSADKKGRNGVHEITYYLASVEGRIAYPTTVYLTEELELITGIQGFLTPEKIEPILHFFNDDTYKTQPNYQEYLKTFKSNL